jgi:hypothetical protein
MTHVAFLWLMSNIPTVIITAAMIFIPHKRSFVIKDAAGRLKGPPKERMRAATATDRKAVAGLRLKRISRPKKTVARRPATRMAITGIATGIGLKWQLSPSSGRIYRSPRAFVTAKYNRFVRIAATVATGPPHNKRRRE